MPSINKDHRYNEKSKHILVKFTDEKKMEMNVGYKKNRTFDGPPETPLNH